MLSEKVSKLPAFYEDEVFGSVKACAEPMQYLLIVILVRVTAETLDCCKLSHALFFEIML